MGVIGCVSQATIRGGPESHGKVVNRKAFNLTYVLRHSHTGFS